jgi:hypothetical protein
MSEKKLQDDYERCNWGAYKSISFKFYPLSRGNQTLLSWPPKIIYKITWSPHLRIPGYRSRGPGFDSRCCQIFWETVGLELSPLSLVSTTEELLGRNSSGSGLENREYGRGDPFRWPRDTLYTQKLALTSPTSGGRSVGIVRLRAKATEFFLFDLPNPIYDRQRKSAVLYNVASFYQAVRWKRKPKYL